MSETNSTIESRRAVFGTLTVGAGAALAAALYPTQNAVAQQRVSLTDLLDRVQTLESAIANIVSGAQPVGALDGSIAFLSAAPSDPPIGRMYYDTTTSNLMIYNGLAWASIAANPFASRIVNVTNHKNSTRRSLPTANSIVLETISVFKHSSTSYLMIEGTLAAFGTHGGSMPQGWRLNLGTEAVAQAVTFTGQSHSLVLGTTAIIAGHVETGSQSLVFRYFTNNGASDRPFTVYNPNASDDSRLAQTSSSFTVWEIEPAIE